MPAYAGGPPPAQMARANASSASGLSAVCLAAAISSGGAPASPLLKCSARARVLEQLHGIRVPIRVSGARTEQKQGAEDE